MVINKKKVYRLCKELNLLKPQRKLKPRHPKKLSRNREITGPNQLWEADIKYGYVYGEDRFFFVLQAVLPIWQKLTESQPLPNIQ